MSNELIKIGGPHSVRRLGEDRYEFSIPLPTDDVGLIGRQCPTDDCSPGYFKVKPGTGLSGMETAFCAYCRNEKQPVEFATQSQVDYGVDIVSREAESGIRDMIKQSFGLDQSGRKKMGGGMFSLEMRMEETAHRPVPRPIEEELRRDLICPECDLSHSVYGLANWCPDCGSDIFTTHVKDELAVLISVIADVPNRIERLGPRIGGKDLENVLEDLVSIVEAVFKIELRRYLRQSGVSQDEIELILGKKVKNAFQSLDRSQIELRDLANLDLKDALSESDYERLASIMEKRHPITHNLGVIDRKFLDQARHGGLEGTELHITIEELSWAVEQVRLLTTWLHSEWFENAA